MAYQDALPLVLRIEEDLRSRGTTLATELPAHAASGHQTYSSPFGELDLNVLRLHHNNERDWIARVLTDASGTTVVPPPVVPIVANDEAAAASLAEAGDLSLGSQPVPTKS